MKKLISIILTICMITTMTGSMVFAEDGSKDYANMEARKESVLNEYKEKVREIELNESTKTRAINEKSNFDLKLEVQADTVRELKEIGYDAYDVNPQTFAAVENTLKTDLTEAGLSEDGAYIITLNEEGFIYPDALTSDPFSHTYNGTTYTLRWLTVRATDDPAFRKASTEDLLPRTTTTQLILNCIDTGIYAWLGALDDVTAFFGTIGSIFGLSVSDIKPATEATFAMQASTEWTQRYAQVWSDYDQAWAFGSCVEEVELNSKVTGYYYDESIYDYVDVTNVRPEQIKYTSHFNDFEWRKNYAVIGYLNSYIYWDTTGDITYKFGEKTVITHRHNF